MDTTGDRRKGAGHDNPDLLGARKPGEWGPFGPYGGAEDEDEG